MGIQNIRNLYIGTQKKAEGCLHLNYLKQKIRLIRYASLLNIEFYDTFSPKAMHILYGCAKKEFWLLP